MATQELQGATVKGQGLRVLFVIDGEDFIDPMGPAYLLAAAKEAGHEGDVLILGNSVSPLDDVREYNPQVIAYSAVTGTHQLYFRFNKRVKEYLGSNLKAFINNILINE